jgi:predicted nuclease of predicted toxin-antitoxin system
MRFKVDENLPIEVAEILRSSGYDAMTIHEQFMVGKPDATVADICRDEKRAIVTLDLDFSDIRTYPPSKYSGIIVLRPNSQSKYSVLELIEKTLPLFATEPLEGCLWILQENGLRIRGE